MFVCETCHDTECAWRLIEPASRGRCEGCGEVRDCVDCHHHKRQPLPKEIHDLIAAKTRVESAPTRIRRSLNADPDALPQCVGDDDFETTPVTVSVPAHLSHTAERRDKVVHVDGCIADLVARLYPLTVSSCCGHGHDAGRIFLADGRLLVIHRPPIPDDALPHTPWGAGQHQASAMRSVRRTHQPHRLHLTNPKDGLWSKAGRLLGRFGTDRHTGGTFESVRRAWRRGNKRRRS